MQVTKRIIETEAVIPVMAALPYAITLNDPEVEPFIYNPETQLTRFAGRRDFSTCREDESVNPLFGKSKSDTKKDD